MGPLTAAANAAAAAVHAQKNFACVDWIDTPGLVDGEMSYPFDVLKAILWMAEHVDMILIFFDPIGQVRAAGGMHDLHCTQRALGTTLQGPPLRPAPCRDRCRSLLSRRGLLGLLLQSFEAAQASCSRVHTCGGSPHKSRPAHAPACHHIHAVSFSSPGAGDQQVQPAMLACHAKRAMPCKRALPC